MSVELDISASQIRCLRRRDAQLVGRSAKAQFTALPGAPDYRALLAAGQIPFAVCDEALTIVGDNAVEYSNLFNVRPQSLMPHGRLPTNDPEARQSLAALVDVLLGEPDQPGEMCGVTLPGGESFQSLATSSELEFFSRLIRLRGFFFKCCPPAWRQCWPSCHGTASPAWASRTEWPPASSRSDSGSREVGNMATSA